MNWGSVVGLKQISFSTSGEIFTLLSKLQIEFQACLKVYGAPERTNNKNQPERNISSVFLTHLLEMGS